MAEGNTEMMSRGVHEKETKAGTSSEIRPTCRVWSPVATEMAHASSTPMSGAGNLGDKREENDDAAMTSAANTNGSHRAPPKLSSTCTNWPAIDSAQPPAGAANPNIVFNCERIIMPPMPQEKPDTTTGGIFMIRRPRPMTENAIRQTPAMMVTFAAPPMPNCATAAARKGTVTVDGPPIKTGLRPSSAVAGAEMMELNKPNSGGNPMSAAIASP